MRTFRIILMAAIAAFSFELLHADSKDCARDYIKIMELA